MINRPRKRVIAAVVAAVVVPAMAWWLLYLLNLAPPPGQPLQPPFNLSDRLDRLPIEETATGPAVVFERDGKRVVYGPEEFLKELKRRQDANTRWTGIFAVFDITNWTGLFWVLFGLIGQCLFAARMLVQWLASERAKASVIPVSFWWLSLVGSSMIIIYFVWRVEIVGIVGQSTGWFVYIRNLWFIHAAKNEET